MDALITTSPGSPLSWLGTGQKHLVAKWNRRNARQVTRAPTGNDSTKRHRRARFQLRRSLVSVEMAVLLLANMRSRPHRSAAHGAGWATGGQERVRLFAELPGLRPGQPERKRRSRPLIGLDVMDNDDEAIVLFIVAELHPPGSKLIRGILVRENRRLRATGELGHAGQALQHIKQQFAEPPD